MVKIMVPNPMNKFMIWGVKNPPLFLLQHPYIKSIASPDSLTWGEASEGEQGYVSKFVSKAPGHG